MAVIQTDINLIDNFSVQYDRVGTEYIKELSSLKKEALSNLKKHGIPYHKNEDYKYFNILRRLRREYSFVLTDVAGHDVDWIDSRLVKDTEGIHIVFINGVFSDGYSTYKPSLEGIEFLDLREIPKQRPDILNLFLEERQNINDDPYMDLNNAFPNAGFMMNITDQYSPGPVYIYHFVTEGQQDLLINHKGIIVLDKDSRADIIEIFYSETQYHYFRNYNSEIFTREGARLNYYVIQETGQDAVSINNINVYQTQNSLVNTFTFSLAGRHLRNNLNILLNEENCESHLFGLYFISNDDLIDNHTTVDHKKPHCFSNEYYKGIINDNGSGTFNGKIFVRPNAQKTNAFQSNKNLVLTESASINAKPQLEIWADDVKCSHGATTGQLDEEQLFYLQSRGLDKESAKALLLHAFAFEIIDKVELKYLRKYIGDKINLRLAYQFSD
jgi:Fe-S cluster assembly protein SufD